MEYQSQDIKSLAAALLEVQKEITPASKDAVNPFCHSKYATLNSVMASCREALLSHQVLLTQYPVPADAPNTLGLVTKLTHVPTGQYMASLAVIPLTKVDAQGLGSAFTYGRRYSLSSMLGIVTEDDDGNSACGKTAKIPEATASQKKVSKVTQTDGTTEALIALLFQIGLGNYKPNYIAYVQQKYNSWLAKLTKDQISEQMTILNQCQNNEIRKRNFISLLNKYRYES